MASIGLLRKPIIPGVGGCPDRGWFVLNSVFGPCPQQLKIGNTGSAVWLAVSFNGGPIVSATCGASAAYVTETSVDNWFDIDVWAAYRAGVWSSSTTVRVYGSAFSGGATIAISGFKGSAFTGVTKSGVSVPLGVYPACPPNLLATFTVTDAGLLTVV
jgi:hypothetical protein